MSALLWGAGIYTVCVVSLFLCSGARNNVLCCFQPAWLRDDGAGREEETPRP